MTFPALVLKNLLRRPMRAALAILGISAGIATVIALGVVTEGLKGSAGDVIHLRGADFMVAQEGTSDLSFSSLPIETVDAVAAEEGVDHASGVLFHIARAGSNPYFVLLGVSPEDLALDPPRLDEGELPANAMEVALGEGAAADLDADVGDEVEIGGARFRVSGIYRSSALWESNGGYAWLSTVQAMAARPGNATIVFVWLEEGADMAMVAANLEERLPNVAAITSVEEFGEVDQGIELLDAANLAISLLAVGIGAIGVMNTMIMSVFERTREIGILRSVGWTGRRVIGMIVLESLMLCAIAVVIGGVLGVGASRLVSTIPAVGGLLEPAYPPAVFVRALAVGFIVALAGAIYPAIRAVRLSPMEALRYE